MMRFTVLRSIVKSRAFHYLTLNADAVALRYLLPIHDVSQIATFHGTLGHSILPISYHLILHFTDI